MRPPAQAVQGRPAPGQARRVADQRAISWPATHLSTADIEERAAILPFAHGHDRVSIRGLSRALAALATFPGDCWQARWLTAGCDEGADWVAALGDPWAGLSRTTRREEPLGALSILLSLDVIRPSYAWLHEARLNRTYRIVRELRDPQFVKQVRDHAREHRHPDALVNNALLVISKIMLHAGKHVAEITPDDVVVYQQAAGARGKVGTEYAWDLLTTFGGFPARTPSLRDFVRPGPMTAADMVDLYQVQCEPVRELLVRYLADRAAVLDHSSLRGLAYKLVGSFWQDLERHHPGIATLELPDEVATSWKTRLRARQADPWPNFIAVRALYLDIAHWATHDAYWAGWAARCPVSITDTRGQAKYSKRVRARLHQKIRSLTPRLPELLRSVDEQLAFHTGLLAVAPPHRPARPSPTAASTTSICS